MATSKEKIAANRKNAKKSTGPKTPRGKKNTGRNALKHGAYSQDLIIRSEYLKEDPAEYEKLLRSITDELQPETLLQESLVRKVANCVWRARRIVAAETASIMREQDEISDKLRSRFRDQQFMAKLDNLDPPEPDPDDDNRFGCLLSALNSVPDYETARHLLYYEMRLDRQLSRAYKLFRELKRASRLTLTVSDDNPVPNLPVSPIAKCDPLPAQMPVAREVAEPERDPSIELPETKPNIPCPPAT